MSRVQSGDAVYVKPGSNMYTVLAGVSVIVTALGLLVIFMRAKELLENGLFGQ